MPGDFDTIGGLLLTENRLIINFKKKWKAPSRGAGPHST